ncbi:MFS transporter [Apilactobacillus timberlakei]|uniref:MFS transporter n=1 Tax=Apilactobacillus timberlakei TaxID=2008380 RepID=UPI00112A9E54|nr:MFS transporter [Apilactobacillus timberlakei]TPR23180.1 MFS transporter [Apilactobacillus timberlakei]
MNGRKIDIVLPVVLIGYFLILLDNSVVFTSTVKIADNLNMSQDNVSWITNIYALMFGSLLLLGGRLGDVYGRKLMLIIGIAIFTLGSFMVGISVSGKMIILMRAIQGIGSSVLAPTTLALLLDNYTGLRRQKAISYYGLTAGIGASVGIIIGGIITNYLSWRWGFLINVPIGIILIFITILFVPDNSIKEKIKLDYTGTALSFFGFFLLVYSIDSSNYKIIKFISAIFFISMFILVEKKNKQPLMPLELFKNRERFWAYITRFLFAGTSISYFFLVPQSLQQFYGYTPLMSAIAFMPETITQFIFGMIQTKISTKLKNNSILIIGIFINSLALILGYLIGLQHGYLIGIAIPMVILGIAQGLAFGPLTSAGVTHTNDRISGAASSVVNVFHQIGSSIILSIVVAYSSNLLDLNLKYNTEFLILSILGVITLITSLNIKMNESKS